MIKLSTLCLAILLTLSAVPPAQALIDVPTLRLAIGPSALSFTAGSTFKESTSLSSKITLNPMFLWDVPSLRMRLGAHFLTDLGSKYGFVSTAGVGFTGILYPLGLSSSREVQENFSEVVKTRVSPYLQVSLTPMKFSISDIPTTGASDPSLFQYFSGRLIEYSFGLGVDYPFKEDLILFGGLHYRAAAFKDEQNKGDIKYSGMSLLIGIMTNFY